MHTIYDDLARFQNDSLLLTLYLSVLMIFIILTFPTISLLIFPFYVSVNLKNRKRDRKTAIFPLTDYFFKITCITENISIISLLITTVIFIFSKVTGKDGYFTKNWTYFWCVLAVCKMNFTIVFDFLTVYLAIQRSSLYFFPRLGNFITLTRGKSRLLVSLLHLLAFCSFYHAIHGPNLSEKVQDNRDSKMQILHLSLNLLVLLASFPYFLMLRSVRKLAHLSTNVIFQPEQFIRFQIMIIISSKFLMIPFILTVQKPMTLTTNQGAPMFMIHLVCESLMCPLIIQSAYLLSSKANLDSFKSSFCCSKRKSSKVDPLVSTAHRSELIDKV